MAPRRILLVHGKAEASFAHSKRFAQYDGAVHVGASRCERATEPRGSVWSARSLLPLWLVPRQHALWNRQDCKGEKLFLFQVQCQWAGRSPISARSKSEMLPQQLYQQEGKRLISLKREDKPRLNAVLCATIALFGYQVPLRGVG